MYDKDLKNMYSIDGENKATIVCYGGRDKIPDGDATHPTLRRCIWGDEALFKGSSENGYRELVCREPICINDETYIDNFSGDKIKSNLVTGNQIFEWDRQGPDDTRNYLKAATCLTDDKMKIENEY